jgi:hypothetical protein
VQARHLPVEALHKGVDENALWHSKLVTQAMQAPKDLQIGLVGN